MSQSVFHFLDLPNEILFISLRNINVLYSLMGVINGKFDTLLQQDNFFTNTLDLITRSSTDDDNNSLRDDAILDPFCIQIYQGSPKIHLLCIFLLPCE